MSETVPLQIIILWEGELRQASKLLHEAESETDDDKRSIKMMQAYLACVVALHGITDEKAVVLCGSEEIRQRARSRREDSTEGKSAEEGK